MNSSVELNSNARKSNSFLRGVVVCVMATKKGVDSIWLRNAPTARATSASAQTAPRVWVRRLTHIFSRTVFNIFAAKAPKTKVFGAFLSRWPDSNRRPHPCQIFITCFFLLPLFVHYSSEVLVSLVLRGLFTAPCCRLLCLVCCGFLVTVAVLLRFLLSRLF